jgi:hypothetical protein
MSDHSRRTFLTGTGAAALGAVALTTAGSAAATAAPTDDAERSASSATSHEPVVAYVTDVTAGRITVMRGDDEVVVTDRALAQRIARQVS